MPGASDKLKQVLARRLPEALESVGHTRSMTLDTKRELRWWLTARRQALARRSGLLRGWAVVWPESGHTDLVPVDVPVSGPGEVTVDVLCSVVSAGTERALYLGLPNARPGFPHRPGYSAAGAVVAVGRGVTGLE